MTTSPLPDAEGCRRTADAKHLSDRARISALELLHRSGGGHYGGVLSVIDILAALYTTAPIASGRGPGDRVILSKGHAAVALYAILAELGQMAVSDAVYGHYASGLEGHPDMTTCAGVHFSTGSLGQGLAVGVGMALGLRASSAHVWVILGDGECQEGQIWESAMLASRYRVGRVHVVVDANGAQECGWTHNRRLDPVPLPDAEAKWRAFGWSAQSVPGHDHDALCSWVKQVRSDHSAPTVAVAQTVKGFGVRLFQDDPSRSHSTELTSEEYERARVELARC